MLESPTFILQTNLYVIVASQAKRQRDYCSMAAWMFVSQTSGWTQLNFHCFTRKRKKTETRVRAIPGHTCPVFAVRSSFNCPQRGWNSAQSAAAPSLRCCATCRCATSSCCFSSRLATFWSYVGNSTSTFCTNNRPQISLLGLLATAVGTHTIESNQKP